MHLLRRQIHKCQTPIKTALPPPFPFSFSVQLVYIYISMSYKVLPERFVQRSASTKRKPFSDGVVIASQTTFCRLNAERRGEQGYPEKTCLNPKKPFGTFRTVQPKTRTPAQNGTGAPGVHVVPLRRLGCAPYVEAVQHVECVVLCGVLCPQYAGRHVVGLFNRRAHHLVYL